MILARKGFKFKDKKGNEWTLTQDVTDETPYYTKIAVNEKGEHPLTGSVIPEELAREFERNLYG